MALNFLIASALVSQNKAKIVDEYTNGKTCITGSAIQKFLRLIAKGLAANEALITTLSAIPVSNGDTNKLWWNESTEKESGITYNYAPFINKPIIRHLFLFFYAFFFTIKWAIKRRDEKTVIVDVLNISISLGCLLAAKIMKIKTIGLVTDMPGLMVGSSNSIIAKINKSYIHSFDKYVLLTQQMNDVINTKNRPYIIMEGLVDINMETSRHRDWNSITTKNIIYAGGLHEKYGLKMLVEAFMRIDNENISLSIYGSGEFVPTLKEYCKQDKRIRYYGLKPNSEIVEEELKACLLVNPRPTNEEFTKYSFPSKNMEYMVSGTPLVTTNLPGMPQQYHDYVYIFPEDNTESFRNTLISILEKPLTELSAKGDQAKHFVLEQKNNVVQAKRIIDLSKTDNKKGA